MEIGNIVEGLARKGFSHFLCLGSVVPKNNDAGVVVLHRKPAIILGCFHLSHVFAAKNFATADISCSRQGRRLKFQGVPCIDKDRCPVVLNDMAYAI